MAQINVNQLTFYYDGSYDNIFEDVSFQIDTDWKLGFIARNGRGKTTFLRLLLGKYEYRGSITSPVEFDYFPYTVSDKDKDTWEVLEEIRPEYELWKLCRELTLLELETEVLYRPFRTLSNGEQTKVMLALLFSEENQFLLIDEPTNHLDREARELVGGYLDKKKGFILVSHDRTFLDKCIDHVLSINKTNIEIQQGNFSSWWENKRRQDAYEIAENERLKKEIFRLNTASRQSAQWADNVEATKIGKGSEKYEKCKDTRAYVGEKSRRMQMRRKNLQRRQNRAMEEKVSLLKNIETADTLKLYPLKHHKEVLVRMEDVWIGYGGKLQDKQVITGLQLCIKNEGIYAIIGKNGCGKSSILKAILQIAGEAFPVSCNDTEEDISRAVREDAGKAAGKDINNSNRTSKLMVSGTIETAGGLKISYVPQDTSHLQGTLEEYAESYGIDLTLFKALLRKLDFSRLQFDKRMEDYSGGQKKKVLIARSLCEKAHLYLWDEPLNFIDIFSRMQIEDLIRHYRPALLMVEHDRAFVEAVGADVLLLDSV